MERRFTAKGKRFLAAVLYFDHRARLTGKKMRMGKVIKAFWDGELARLRIRVNIR